MHTHFKEPGKAYKIVDCNQLDQQWIINRKHINKLKQGITVFMTIRANLDFLLKRKWNRQIFNLPVPMKSACSFLALPVPEQVEQALRKGLLCPNQNIWSVLGNS